MRPCRRRARRPAARPPRGAGTPLIDYYAGRNIDAKGVRTSQGYTWWERNLPDSYLLKELNSMINDSDRDNNYLLLPEDTILEERYAWKKATASEASPSEAGRQ